jgi:hypothetical protein
LSKLKRYVLSSVERGLKGKKNLGSAVFLNDAPSILKRSSIKSVSASDLLNLDTYIDMMAFLTVKLVRKWI